MARLDIRVSDLLSRHRRVVKARRLAQRARMYASGRRSQRGCIGNRYLTCWIGSFEVLVVNAQHIKAVPGRKTDVKDAEWIADLLHHGLLKASFIPSGPGRELRDLTRYRVRLTEEKAREVQSVQKTLEDTNLKLGDVGSSIMGKASRMILHAIADGESDPGR